MVSKFQWNCPECTFLHNYHFPRCQMCGAERKSKNGAEIGGDENHVGNGNFRGCLPITVNAIDDGKSNKDVFAVTTAEFCNAEGSDDTNNAFSKKLHGPLHNSFNNGSNGGEGNGNRGYSNSNLSSPGESSKNILNPYSKRRSQETPGQTNNNFKSPNSSRGDGFQHVSSRQMQQNTQKPNFIQMQQQQQQNVKNQFNDSTVGNAKNLGSNPTQQNIDLSTPSTKNPYKQSSCRMNPYASRGKRNPPTPSTASSTQEQSCNIRRSIEDQTSQNAQQLHRHTPANQIPPQSTPTATYHDRRSDDYSRSTNTSQINQSYPQRFPQQSSMHGTTGERNNTPANIVKNVTNSFFQPDSQRRQQRNQWQQNQQQQQFTSPDGRPQPLGDLFFRQSTPRCKELPYTEGPISLSQSTRNKWIYPIDEKYPERKYQLEISHSCIMKNTLVSLPTGLGKTLIAAVVMYNYYRWFPSGKIVFCAPTRPLVTQQIEACHKIMGIPAADTAEISGKNAPESRVALWKNRRVFFCTPQTLAKDIKEQRCDAESIVCVVMDEAHRATGNHANVVLVNLIEEAGAKFRIVGLSATPGAGIKEIRNVVSTLRISQIEVRTEDDPVVKQYIHDREEENIIVKQPDAVKMLDSKFSELVVPILDRLREEKVSPQLQYNSANLKPFTVLTAWKEYKEKTGDHRLDGHFDTLRGLTNIRQLLKEHGVLVAKTKLTELMQTAKFDLLRKLTQKPSFVSLWQELSRAADSNYDAVGSQPSPEDLTFNNPKYSKLVEVLVEHFERKQAVGESTRAIVFSQWRESVTGIVAMLSSKNPSLLKPTPFIGQSNKSAPKGKRRGGMNQSQQQKVLNQFSNGIYNVLVCTCVGEEGLDIGEVDLIVNFDVVKSSIRSIQRSGRTGRARVGRVINLMSEGQEVRSFNESKENAKKIARSLKDPKVFKFCPNNPMFPEEPELFRQNMMVKAFHMSQVGGHTPKIRKLHVRAKRVRNCNAEVDDSWKISLEQEIERRKHFGYLPHTTSCQKFEKNCGVFPASLQKKYLKYRRQSTTASGKGLTCTTLRDFEKRFLTKVETPMLKRVTNDKEFILLQASGEVEKSGKATTSEDLFNRDDDDALDVCSHGSLVGSVHGIYHDSKNDIFENNRLDDKNDSPNMLLDEIFGPISGEGSQCLEQISYIFDSFDRRHYSIAPPRDGVDSPICGDSFSFAVSIESGQDDDSMTSHSSKQSQLSVNTINDDLLCAFFEKNDAKASLSDQSSDNEPFLTPKPDSNKFQCDDSGEYSTGGDFQVSQQRANVAVSDVDTEGNFADHPQIDIDEAVYCPTENSIPSHHITHREDVVDKEKRVDSADAHEIGISFPDEAEKQTAESTISFGEVTSQGNFVNDQNESIESKSRGVVYADSDALGELVQVNSSDAHSHDDARIVAFQLPTPPESSDDDSHDTSVSDHKDRCHIDVPTCELQGCVVKENNEHVNNKKSRNNIAPEDDEKNEETDPFNRANDDIQNSQESNEEMAPLHLPTQFSSSSDDEDDDDKCEVFDDHSDAETEKTKLDTMVNEDLIDRTESSRKEVSVCCESTDLRSKTNSPSALKESSKRIREGHRDQQSKQHHSLDHLLADTSDVKHVHFQNLTSQIMASDDLIDTPKRAHHSNPFDDCLTDTPEFSQGGRKRPCIGPDDLTDTPGEKPPANGVLEPRVFAEHRKRLKHIADSFNSLTPEPCNIQDDLTDTPVRGRLCRQGHDHSDECLTDTPVRNKGVCQKNPSFSPDELTDTPIERTPSVGIRRHRVAGQRKRLRTAKDIGKEKQESPDKNRASKKDLLKKKIEEKYKCRFLDTEAANDDSDNDSDEEDEVRQIESEELSHDSFINDGSQLGYTQDDLDRINADSEVVYSCDDGDDIHRQVDHQHNIDNQFITPVFNRRMRRPELSQSLAQPSSQKGLGNMHFIRSVLEHHRQGGDADELEEEYRRLVGHDSPSVNSGATAQNSPFGQHNRLNAGYSPTCHDANPLYRHTTYSPPIGTNPAPARRIDTTRGENSVKRLVNQVSGVVTRNDRNISLDQSPVSTEKPPALTSEQRAMIETKRLEALRRRQQRMQQQQQQQEQQHQQQQKQKQLQQETPSSIRINPYAR